ncbi:MAG: sulfatase-like hydrolase/transferase, partial [Planctomycetota bacterium]
RMQPGPPSPPMSTSLSALRPGVPETAARRQALFRLWLLNVVAGALIGSLWFFDAPETRAPWIRAYVALALVSSVAVLAALPGIFFLALERWMKPAWLLGLVSAGAGALFLAVLYTDTIVYRLLRYHFFDSAVLNVAFTEGSGDSIVLGGYIWTTTAVVLGSVTLLQYLCFVAFARRAQRSADRGLRPHLLLQPRTVLALGLLPSLLFSQTVSAAADVAQNREAIRAIEPLPAVPRVRLGQILDPLLDEDSDLPPRPPELDLLPRGARLDWPRVRPEIAPGPDAPNIVICVLDSWRRDMFTPELTPRIDRFSRGARVFRDHLAGGNGTRYGLFTMLYGLHGSYWFPTLQARRTPLLVDAVQDAGYDVRVFSSASMSFPEFRQTAWAGLRDGAILDSFDEGLVSWQKDVRSVDAFDAWLELREQRGETAPFFSFHLVDAPHQPYHNPGGPHRPAVGELDYIELGRTTEGPELAALQRRVLNQYKNSVMHADGTVGRLLDSLERRGELENSIVIITGDHGEEFFECGFWGHTSSFSPVQVEVPFLIAGPGIDPGEEHRPTSHLDVSPTLLERLGADPALRPDYCFGENLFDPPARRDRVVAGWADVGLWTDSGIFEVPLRAPGIGGFVQEIECFDARWRPFDDVGARCAEESEALGRLAAECRRFLALRP